MNKFQSADRIAVKKGKEKESKESIDPVYGN